MYQITYPFKGMENAIIGPVSLSVYYDTRRVKNDLTFPVKYRVTYKGRRNYYAADVDLTEEDWKRLPTTRDKDLIDLKKLIQSGFEKVRQHIKEIIEDDGFSFNGLSRRLARGRKNSLIGAFENKIIVLEKAGQIGTSITYQCALNSIGKFTKADIKLSDVSIDWLKRYENHLLSEEKTRTTIKFYIGCIRALMNEARQEKLITEAGYPFGKGKFEIKTGVGRKLALTLAQIKAVMDHPLQTDFEIRCRDLWYFSYLCNGINFHDMLKLKYKNIAGGEIYFIRQKTYRTTKEQKEIVATLLPEMQSIIRRWGNPSKQPDNYIFPFLSNGLTPIDEKRIIQNVVRLVNKKMERISKALNYDLISTYTARHSYATVLKRSGANIAFISESLGHTDLRTTEAYLSSFETEERAKNASKLVQF
jgi:integrase/recombinase XerD